jgi:energy-coupling factor transport system permease protein
MNGGFRSLHPLTCVLYYAGAIALGMVMTHPLFILTLIGLTALLIALHGELASLGRLLKYYTPLAILFVLANPLFSHRGRHVLTYAFGQPITLESLLYGLISMGTILAVLILFTSYQAVITPPKFLRVFGSLFPKTALMTTVAVRFVPLMRRRLMEIAAVQRTKGIDVTEGRLTKRVSDGMMLLQLLLSVSLEEALQTADAMKAKGYGTGPRGRFEEYHFSLSDRTILTLLTLLAAACLAGRMQGYGDFPIFPVMQSFAFTTGDTATWLAYFLYLAVPPALEGRRIWAWRSWKSLNSASATPKNNILR